MAQTHFFKTALYRFCQYLGAKARRSLSSCEIRFITDGIEINCPDEKTVQELYDFSQELTCAAYRLNLGSKIIVTVGSEAIFSLPTDLLLLVQPNNIMSQHQLFVPPRELHLELEEHSRGACLIRNNDHKGLSCNSLILQISACHPNDWVGQDMSRYWDRSELKRFLVALREDTELHEFTYQAYLFDETLCEFCVDARLVFYHGQECRIVKNLGCRPL